MDKLQILEKVAQELFGVRIPKCQAARDLEEQGLIRITAVEPFAYIVELAQED